MYEDRIEILKDVMKEHFQEVIDSCKRHIKELVDQRIGLDDDWNLYVVEQWKTIRQKKKLLMQLEEI